MENYEKEKETKYPAKPGKHSAGWQMEFLSLSLSSIAGTEREREWRRQWQTGNKEVTHSLSPCLVLLYISSFWTFFNFWFLWFWISDRRRRRSLSNLDLQERETLGIGINHHESLRSWKQVYHLKKIASFFSSFILIFQKNSSFSCVSRFTLLNMNWGSGVLIFWLPFIFFHTKILFLSLSFDFWVFSESLCA